MSGAVRRAVDRVFDSVSGGTCDDPFAILGPHRDTVNGRPVLIIRTFQPAASGRPPPSYP